MKKRTRIALALAAVLSAGLWLNNTSLFAQGEGRPTLLAHRGMHQRFDTRDLRADTRTAQRMQPAPHRFIENTLASMRAAFEAGADVVELDVHPTTDGEFAVFHDWTLECRTEGRGRTRDHAMAQLRQLDVGHGYTPDGGKTFPLRGTGVGLMPSLAEVLAAFPERRFVIHVKSRDAGEGERLAAVLGALPMARQRQLIVYGGNEPVDRVRERLPAVKTASNASLKGCLLRYAALGWSGYVPQACRNAMVLVPLNVAPWLWGWPHRLVDRLQGAGSELYVLGPWRGGEFSTGIDSEAGLAQLPPGFRGGIWTNEIGPLARALTSSARTPPPAPGP